QLWDELADDSATLANMAATQSGHLIAALAAHPTAIIVTATTDLLEGINALHCDDDKEHHRVTQAIGDAPNWDRITRLAAALKAITPYATATTSANIHAMMSWINVRQRTRQLSPGICRTSPTPGPRSPPRQRDTQPRHQRQRLTVGRL